MNRIWPTDARTVAALRQLSKRGQRALQPLRNAVGLKRWYIPGSEFEGTGVRTRYANKELQRRRKAGRAAKLARRRNR